MEAESLRSQFESELAWRQEEIAFMKNQLIYIEEDKKNKYRKSMVLMLYAHFEGFTKIALQMYLQYINDMDISLLDVNAHLQASALKKEFNAYDDLDRKAKIFKKKLPQEDERIHRLFRRVEFIERFDEFRDKKLRIDDDVIDTESNLWYVVLQKNLYRCGLSIDLFKDQMEAIDSLVNRRNSIAHGNIRAGVTKEEYEKWESQTYDVMNQIIRTLFECAVNKSFLASGD